MALFLILPLFLAAFDDYVGNEIQEAANDNEHKPIRGVTHHNTSLMGSAKTKTAIQRTLGGGPTTRGILRAKLPGPLSIHSIVTLMLPETMRLIKQSNTRGNSQV